MRFAPEDFNVVGPKCFSVFNIICINLCMAFEPLDITASIPASTKQSVSTLGFEPRPPRVYDFSRQTCYPLHYHRTRSTVCSKCLLPLKRFKQTLQIQKGPTGCRSDSCWGQRCFSGKQTLYQHTTPRLALSASYSMNFNSPGLPMSPSRHNSPLSKRSKNRLGPC